MSDTLDLLILTWSQFPLSITSKSSIPWIAEDILIRVFQFIMLL